MYIISKKTKLKLVKQYIFTEIVDNIFTEVPVIPQDMHNL